MSWLEKQFGQSNSQAVKEPVSAISDDRMSPGLTGEYDWKLRMDAGMHEPPPTPDCMGLQGEYDPKGLAKRVAVALDREIELEDSPNLNFEQVGSTIIFKGSIPCQSLLDRMVEIAAKVDGTKAVDTAQVTISS